MNSENFYERRAGVLLHPTSLPSGILDRDVERWLELLRGAGLETVDIHETAGHPIVFASWTHKPDAPTLLIYGHYDVQPIVDESEWTSPPFDPQIKDGKIWARGATDDKGQLLTHVLAAEAHLATHGELPINVKFLLEGEEEIGSEHLEGFVQANRERAGAARGGARRVRLPAVRIGHPGRSVPELGRPQGPVCAAR